MWVAHCTACRGPKRGHQVDDYATQTSDLAWPILANLGFSGVCGIAAAVALKVGFSGACSIAAAISLKLRSAGAAASCCVRG